jgi:hypothetical protein
MITELTPTQKARFAEFVHKWTAIGRCTDPANREQAERGIHLAYQNAGLEPPKQVVWCASPMGMYLTKHALIKGVRASVGASVWASVRASVRASVWASVWASVGDSVGDSVWDSVRDSVRDSVGASVRASVWDSVRASVWASVGASVWASVGASVGDSVGDSVWASVGDSVWDSVRDSVGASVWDSVYGQHDAAWLAFYDYLGTVCELASRTEKLGGLMQVAQSAGWWLPYTNICFVSERHNVLNFDAEDRLHGDGHPSITFPDGWAIYHWHGLRVSEDIIMKPISFDQIMAEENAEIKRVMIERFGENNFVKSLSVEPLDASEWGKFYRVDYGDTEPLCLVRVVDPSTDRVYFNQVPPVDDSGQPMLRAKQAIAWRFGLSEQEYMPLIEA